MNQYVKVKDSIVAPCAICEASKGYMEGKGAFSHMFDMEGVDNFFSYIKDLSAADYSGSSDAKDFSYMFAGCGKLVAAPIFDTKKGENFSYMFKGCSGLLHIPAYDLGNAKNLEGMLSGCVKLNSFDCVNIAADIDLSGCPDLLTKDKLVGIFGRLKNYSSEGGVHTITIGKEAMEALSVEDLDVAMDKGWIVA